MIGGRNHLSNCAMRQYCNQFSPNAATGSANQRARKKTPGRFSGQEKETASARATNKARKETQRARYKYHRKPSLLTRNLCFLLVYCFEPISSNLFLLLQRKEAASDQPQRAQRAAEASLSLFSVKGDSTEYVIAADQPRIALFSDSGGQSAH